MIVIGRLRPAAVRRAAFTLIELLVVISVIMLLAGLALPTMMQAIAMSERVRCGNNLGQISRGMFVYANQFSKFFPANRPRSSGCGDDNLAPLFEGKYVADIKTFACPATEDIPLTADDLKYKPTDPSKPTGGGEMSYEYWGENNPCLGLRRANTTILVVAHDEEGYGVNVYIDKDNHGASGINVLFLDSHVDWAKPREWYPGPTSICAVAGAEWGRVRR